VLWLHVLCGVSWVGAAAAFALAAAALSGQQGEPRAFALRVAPQLNRWCLGAAVLVPLSGAANLGFALAHRGRLPLAFLRIVGIKLGLFTLMAVVLWRAIERTAAVASRASGLADDGAAAVGRLVRLYGLMAAIGGVALLMGLWLAGV
jgi:hypothetical protein